MIDTVFKSIWMKLLGASVLVLSITVAVFSVTNVVKSSIEIKERPPEGVRATVPGNISSLSENYVFTSANRRLAAARADSFDDENSSYVTNEFGRPKFLPSPAALSDGEVYQSELTDYKKDLDKFIDARTKAIPSAFEEEISEIEATIEQAVASGSRTAEEINEANESLEQMRQARDRLEAYLAEKE